MRKYLIRFLVYCLEKISKKKCTLYDIKSDEDIQKFIKSPPLSLFVLGRLVKELLNQQSVYYDNFIHEINPDQIGQTGLQIGLAKKVREILDLIKEYIQEYKGGEDDS